ncbi:Kelch repeat-containing protein [Nocardia sp. NPDC050175]|uniref:Kelch repeat-containing protein n=1 Tax=Nocardia sp. NPDC050175 TaxID=3364317 RepID=UPI0037BA9929
MTSLAIGTNLWIPTGNLPAASLAFENDCAMAGLAEGSALLAGGADATFAGSAAAALFDPAISTWKVTTPMAIGRRLHTVTRLPDGTALAAGGITGPYRLPFDVVAAAERFDPKTKTWTPTRTGMGTPRCLHSATLLADGRVLVAGGATLRSANGLGPTNTAEVYDPVADKWEPTGSMIDARTAPQSVLLADGRVLVVGGTALVGDEYAVPTAFCEVYDPKTGKWSPTGSLALPRALHRAVLLPDGSVLALGGCRQGWSSGPIFDKHSLATTERWYPVTDRWAPAASMPAGRDRFHAFTLRSGKVLAFGGGDEQNLSARFASSVLYDPYADTWSSTGPMYYGRMDFAAALLSDGRVVAAGGSSGDDLPTVAEMFLP